MKKLYDEIMAIPESSLGDDGYNDGFYEAKQAAAELAKKYDDEIASLKSELDAVNEHIDTWFNDGLIKKK